MDGFSEMDCAIALGASLLMLGACGPDEPLNQPPVVQVSLNASSALLHDLQATSTSSDADGDAVQLSWRWKVDGVDTDFDGPTVPYDALAWDQVWTVTALADDGQQTTEATASTTITHLGGNILVVVADDLGVDHVGVYGIHDQAPPTPTLDALAEEGVLFRNAWAQATCSPSRASLLTGRYPRRTGIGRWIQPQEETHPIDAAEVIIPEMLELSPANYADSAVGKFHLGSFVNNTDPGADPLRLGFSWFSGSLGNPINSYSPSFDGPKSYDYWEKSVNGALAFTDVYMTIDTTNDALLRMGEMPEPWFLWVTYNAPHSPLHVPPPELHTYDLDPASAPDVDLFDAMVQSFDTELGRLLAGLSAEQRSKTTIVFLSDNGTPEHGVREPLNPDRSKGSLFEGGVNVPWIVAGPAVSVPGAETTALIGSVDLFHTVAEIAGVDVGAVIDPRTGLPVVTDGVSFLSHVLDPDLPSTRDRIYTSKHYPNGPRPWDNEQDALRDAQYKVTFDPDVGWQFFEFRAPFDEGPNLLKGAALSENYQAAFDDLSFDLAERMDSMNVGP